LSPRSPCDPKPLPYPRVMEVKSEHQQQPGRRRLDNPRAPKTFREFPGALVDKRSQDNEKQRCGRQAIGACGMEFEERHRSEIAAIEHREKTDRPSPLPLCAGRFDPGEACEAGVDKKAPQRCRQTEKLRPTAIQNHITRALFGTACERLSAPGCKREISRKPHTDKRQAKKRPVRNCSGGEIPACLTIHWFVRSSRCGHGLIAKYSLPIPVEPLIN
jgi:hypothetical protein